MLTTLTHALGVILLFPNGSCTGDKITQPHGICGDITTTNRRVALNAGVSTAPCAGQWLVDCIMNDVYFSRAQHRVQSLRLW